MITKTVRFFEDKEDGDEEFVNVTASDFDALQDAIDNLWQWENREEKFDGVE